MALSRLYRDTSDPLLDQSLLSLKYFVHNYVKNETKKAMQHVVSNIEQLFRLAFLASRVLALFDQQVNYFVDLKKTRGLQTACKCTNDQHGTIFELNGTRKAYALSKLELNDEDFVKLCEYFEEQLDNSYNCDSSWVFRKKKVRSDMINIHHDYCVLIGRTNARLFDLMGKLRGIGHLQFIPVKSTQSILESLCRLTTCKSLPPENTDVEMDHCASTATPIKSPCPSVLIISPTADDDSIQLCDHYSPVSPDMIEYSLCDLDSTIVDCNDDLIDEGNHSSQQDYSLSSTKETNSLSSYFSSASHLRSSFIFSPEKDSPLTNASRSITSGQRGDYRDRTFDSLDHSYSRDSQLDLDSAVSCTIETSLSQKHSYSPQSDSCVELESTGVYQEHEDHNYYFKRNSVSSTPCKMPSLKPNALFSCLQ